MNKDQDPSEQAPTAERRQELRRYLTRPLRAELVYGRSRFGVDSGRVDNVSPCGLGLRSSERTGVVSGTIATVAVARQDQVLTLSGEIVSVRNGVDLGIRLNAAELDRVEEFLGDAVESCSVSVPKNGSASVAGNLSAASLHPLRWAVRRGAGRLSLSGVSAIDSAGIALLLLLNEQSDVTVEMCPDFVCRLLRGLGTTRLCGSDCQKNPGS